MPKSKYFGFILGINFYNFMASGGLKRQNLKVKNLKIKLPAYPPHCILQSLIKTKGTLRVAAGFQ